MSKHSDVQIVEYMEKGSPLEGPPFLGSEFIEPIRIGCFGVLS